MSTRQTIAVGLLLVALAVLAKPVIVHHPVTVSIQFCWKAHEPKT